MTPRLWPLRRCSGQAGAAGGARIKTAAHEAVKANGGEGPELGCTCMRSSRPQDLKKQCGR